MIICESGLARRIKRAYGSGGYTVARLGQDMVIYTNSWMVRCPLKIMPRKALAAVVEHIGTLPERDEGLNVRRDMDPQTVLLAEIEAAVRDWDSAQETEDVTMTLVTYKGEQIFQAAEDGQSACYGISLADLELLEYGAYRRKLAVAADGRRLGWCADDEEVYIWARSTSRGCQDYKDKAIWDALECIDLKPKDMLEE